MGASIGALCRPLFTPAVFTELERSTQRGVWGNFRNPSWLQPVDTMDFLRPAVDLSVLSTPDLKLRLQKILLHVKLKRFLRPSLQPFVFMLVDFTSAILSPTLNPKPKALNPR